MGVKGWVRRDLLWNESELSDIDTVNGAYVEEVPSESLQRIQQLEDESKKLRLLLFQEHLFSNAHICYGGDGQKQCITCNIDFYNDNVDDIIFKSDRLHYK